MYSRELREAARVTGGELARALEYIEQRGVCLGQRKPDRHRLKRQVRMRLTEEAYVEFERPGTRHERHYLAALDIAKIMLDA